jgi:hypothetical protein
MGRLFRWEAIEMATVINKLVIEADPKKPVEEIGNIITAFLQMWPGSETLILQGVRKAIDEALPQFEAAKSNLSLSPDPAPATEQNRPPNRQERRQQHKRR